MYRHGRGVPQDHAEAVRWCRLTAEQGDANAQSELGFMYDYGKGVPEDGQEAVHWLRLAAEQADAYAQAYLGLKYSFGEGVPEDLVLAYMWSNLASAQGHPIAANHKATYSQWMTREQIAEAQRLSRECLARNYKGC
jgi:TPR repeat protein